MAHDISQSGSGVDAFMSVLTQAGIVDNSLLEWAAQQSEKTRQPAYELIARREPSHEQKIYSLLAEFLGVDYEQLSAGEINAELTEYVDSTFATKHSVAPLRLENNTLILATSQPAVLAQGDAIAMKLGCGVRLLLAGPSQLTAYTQNLYGLGAETLSRLVIEESDSSGDVLMRASREVALQEHLDSSQEASLTQFVNRILIEAVKSKASDIHIEPGENQLRVRFRIDGVLHEIPVPPAIKQLEQAIISRIKVLADLDIAEKRLCQDGQLRLKVAGRTIDVRVSVLPSIYGESLVLRLLDRQMQFRELAEIGMPGKMLEQYREVLTQAQGLVLVTGPTGSGKTTTLYASLNHVNTPGRKIVTVEDPVEYRLDGITQIQVRQPIGLDFANILRSVVRHDPDIIMVGEIRDETTANTAINAAITGHLVFATVHTNDAPTAIGRLANMRVPWYMIASALKVVVAQRLVRLLCEKCRQPVGETGEEILRTHPQLAGATLYKSVGCDACRHTGYAGRTGIYESMVITDDIAAAIAASDRSEIHRLAMAQGLVPLSIEGLKLVATGKTSLEELYRVTRDVTRAGA